jgi:hypothetical protein
MAKDDYRPRISAEIRQDQFDRLQQILPHGMHKLLFQALIDGVLELYDRGGFNAVGAIVSGYVNAKHLADAGLPYTHSTMMGEKK